MRELHQQRLAPFVQAVVENCALLQAERRRGLGGIAAVANDGLAGRRIELHPAIPIEGHAANLVDAK
tara:strand:- start:177 stop:377 length:201 start_codon:yes stop_codon:yes gene_type:complete